MSLQEMKPKKTHLMDKLLFQLWREQLLDEYQKLDRTNKNILAITIFFEYVCIPFGQFVQLVSDSLMTDQDFTRT